jgi:hypothetical protein
MTTSNRIISFRWLELGFIFGFQTDREKTIRYTEYVYCFQVNVELSLKQ